MMVSKKDKKKPKLTPKKELFCQNYVVYHNAARAAREAGYSAKSDNVTGSQFLTNPNIQARIVELQGVTADKFNVMKQHLVGILVDIARAKVEDIMDPETGAVLPPNLWPEHMKRVISGIESDELYAGALPIGMKRKVRLSDRTKAIELLNKMCGFNMPDKVAQTDISGMQDIIPVIKIYPVQAKNEED